MIAESTCVTVDETECHQDKLVMVIDMGGGTLDISLISMGDGIMEVLYVAGDRSVGGIDYDYCLGEYIKRVLKDKYPGIMIDTFLETQILFKAEEVKILLSAVEKANVIFSGCYCTEKGTTKDCCVEVTRAEFRKVSDFLNSKVKEILKNCKKEIAAQDIDILPEIVLGGLGSKIFTVRETIEECFPGFPVRDVCAEKRLWKA